MRRHEPLSIAMLATLALAGSLTLGGCFLLPAADSGSVSTDEASSSAEDSGDSATEEEGSTSSGDSLDLPDGFPDIVPLVDGPVVVSEDLGTGWAVWVEVEDATAQFEEAGTLLEDAGFTEEDSFGNAEAGYYASFSRDIYQVQLTAADDMADDSGPVVAYTIYRTA
jgi:hypothetical protein